ncbi:DUF11 domain-containing protein [Nocardioides sp. BGMRC 2183]|nr:DUF11 domain-containing protein [Nocardioides sp. BGMRC 2183]
MATTLVVAAATMAQPAPQAQSDVPVTAATTPASAPTAPFVPMAAPGVPEDPTVVLSEGFENRPGSTPIVRVDDYVGSAGETYTAAPSWLVNCNGWVAQWNQPPSAAAGASAQVADCGQQQWWNRTQQLAQALGISQGETAAEARDNFAVSALTFGDPGAGLVELATAENVPLASAGRFLTTSVDVAALSCSAGAPRIQFQLIDDNGTATDVGGPINACATSRRVTAEARGVVGATAVTVDTYTSNGSILWDSPTIGMQMINLYGSGRGNDHAFDNFEIVDATPSLDKAFTPEATVPGEASTLTFTVTNTSELAAKNGWSFTDSLPEGLVVADPSAATTTCPSGEVTATAGGSTITGTGNLSAGMTSCTLSVDVVANDAGLYTNGPDNVETTGLEPPENTTLVVTTTDFGDAPASYGTETTRHSDVGLSMGVRDPEPAARATPDASGDDLDGTDDEDAVADGASWRSNHAPTLDVAITNTTGGPATLVGWVDLNRDGDFDDPDEQSAIARLSATDTSATLTWSAVDDAATGPSFLRLRLYAGSPDTPSPVGFGGGGEVEDHPLELQTPGIEVEKSASPVEDLDGNGVDAGDTITYTVTVTNTGNAPLHTLTVNDPLLGGDIACGSANLSPGATRTCPTIDYTLTQDDLEAGEVDNEVTATGTPPDGPAVSDTATTHTVLDAAPAIALDKSAGPVIDADGNGPDAGDTVSYTFEVTNTGNRWVRQVTVADPTTGPVSCPQTILAPGASMDCSVTYTLTQADVDAGSVDNTATVSAVDVDDTPVEDEDSATVTIAPTSDLTLDKQVAGVVDTNGSGVRDAGDTINYEFVVTNDGATTLTGVAVDDALVEVDCPTGPLAPGASVTCTASYVITQSDADAGSVDNTATATASDPDGEPVESDPDATSTPINPVARLVLDKQAADPVDENGNELVDAGDTIGYTFELTNTGNVTLSALQVSDPKVGTVDCPVATLAPGGSTTCTATYTITQADVDNGAVLNSAQANGETPAGQDVPSNQDGTTTPTDSTSELSLDKSVGGTDDVDGSGGLNAGDTISYAFEVTNDGTTTVTGVGIDDDLTGGADCPQTRLAPGATTTCTFTYTVTQADVDAGSVDNAATATGSDPAEEPVESEPDSTSTPTDATASLRLLKLVRSIDDVDGSGTVNAGDTITYSFLITNTGAVTLTDVAVDDPKLGAIDCPDASVPPGTSPICSATYTVTQADVDSGSVDNTATATATDPNGEPVESDPSSTSTPTDSTAALTLDKQAAPATDVNDNGLVDAGDTIDYRFVVTNTGQVSLDTLEIEDPTVGAVDCPVTDLDPDGATTCTATYTITQADVDAGSVVNTATANAEEPGGGEVASLPDSTTTPTDSTPELTLAKSVAGTTDVNDNGLVDAGDTIRFEFLVENTGTVTVDFIRVIDPKVGAVDCPRTTLQPGQSTTCAKTYTITQADVDAGSVANTATATGTDPDDEPVDSNDSSTDTPTDTVATLSIDKTATGTADTDDDGLIATGDTIDYSFVVTNTGTVTASVLTVEDPKVGAVDCPVTSLAPGASTTCTATYTVTQADTDSGRVVNRARALAEDPDGDPIESPRDSTTTPLDSAPALEIAKSAGDPVDANDSGRTDAGDTIAYTFTVTNTGNQTVDDLAVVDPMLAAAGDTISCDVTELAPEGVATCEASYTIRPADLDAGEVDNTAHATADDPDGDPVDSPDDTAVVPLPQEPALTIDKVAGDPVDANDSGRTDAGDTIAYTFTVTNTGNVTVTDLAVDDPMLADAGVGIDCGASTLAAGSQTVCTATYTLTTADLDAGSVENTAHATGADPNDDTVDSPDDTAEVDLTQLPALTVDKAAGAPVDANDSGRTDAGDTIAYTFTVTNTGNVTLTDLAIDDPMLADAGVDVDCPGAPLPAGEESTCTATYTLTPADLDAGEVANTAHATGTDPGGDPVDSPDDTAVVPLAQEPALALEKSAGAPADANGSGRIDAGDTIAYDYTVTNTGNVALRSITVADDKIDDVACEPTVIAPGEVATCTGSYTLVQADLDAGEVVNVATATGETPGGAAVDSPEDTAAVPLAQLPALDLSKTASLQDRDGDDRADAGETVSYTFEVANTGNVTVADITIDDPMLEDAGVNISCPADSTLAPGDSLACTASYPVSAADVRAGDPLTNTATASGTDPTGSTAATDPDTAVVPTDEPDDGNPDGGGNPDGEGNPGGDGFLPDTGAPRVTLALLFAVILLLAGGVTAAAGRRRR